MRVIDKTWILRNWILITLNKKRVWIKSNPSHLNTKKWKAFHIDFRWKVIGILPTPIYTFAPPPQAKTKSFKLERICYNSSKASNKTVNTWCFQLRKLLKTSFAHKERGMAEHHLSRALDKSAAWNRLWSTVWGINCRWTCRIIRSILKTNYTPSTHLLLLRREKVFPVTPYGHHRKWVLQLAWPKVNNLWIRRKSHRKVSGCHRRPMLRRRGSESLKR